MTHAVWRRMTEADLPAVPPISDVVHGQYTERLEVFAERLTLYPQGCFVLEKEGEIIGYLVTHPWHEYQPVDLDVLLGEIPAETDTYFLHDIALLPAARGSGAGAEAVRLVLDHARGAGFAQVALVAVNGADSFWATRGFVKDEADAIVRKLHASYGEGVYYMVHKLTA